MVAVALRNTRFSFPSSSSIWRKFLSRAAAIMASPALFGMFFVSSTFRYLSSTAALISASFSASSARTQLSRANRSGLSNHCRILCCSDSGRDSRWTDNIGCVQWRLWLCGDSEDRKYFLDGSVLKGVVLIRTGLPPGKTDDRFSECLLCLLHLLLGSGKLLR